MENEKTPEERYAETLRKQEEKRKKIKKRNPEALKRMDEMKKQNKEKREFLKKEKEEFLKKKRDEILRKKSESKFNVNFKSLIIGVIFAIVFVFVFLFSNGEVELWAMVVLLLGILGFHLIFESRPISQTIVVLVGILVVGIISNHYGFYGINITGALIIFALYGFYLSTRIAITRFKKVVIDGVSLHVPKTLVQSYDGDEYFYREYIKTFKGGTYLDYGGGRYYDSNDGKYKHNTTTTPTITYGAKIRVYKYKSLEQVLSDFESYKIEETVFGKYSGFRVDKINSTYDGFEPEWFVFEKEGRVVAVNFESDSMSSFKLNTLNVINGRSGIGIIY